MGRLYVGNLPWSTTEEDLKNHFNQCGNVTGVSLVTDRETGRSRGFGFVDIDNCDGAIQAMNGVEFQGRKLVVNMARERAPRPPR